jgi:hypothetical protein
MKKSLAWGTLLLAAIVSWVMLSRMSSPDRKIPEASRAVTGESDDREERARHDEVGTVAPSRNLNAHPPAVLGDGRETRWEADVGPSSAATMAPHAAGARNLSLDPVRLTPQESGNRAGESVEVGRPFPIPRSIRDVCEKGPGHVCDVVLPEIDKMGKERRDLAWAPAAEQRLLELLGSATGQFTVRALECRTSLCVAEVASSGGPHPGIGGYRAEVDNGLYSRGVLTGYEESDQGVRVTVRLFVYERR